MAVCDLQNRAPSVTRTHDFRNIVERRYDVLNWAPKTPADILAQCWLPLGTVDDLFTACYLTDQKIEGQAGDFNKPCELPPVLVRTFTELNGLLETQIGNPSITVNQYGYREVEINLVQLSAGTASYQVPGMTAAPAPNNDCILREQHDTNDGTLISIKRIYVAGGFLDQVDTLKFGGHLLLRRLKYLNQVPPTPAGFTLVEQSKYFVNGLPVYEYGFASASGSIGGGGEIGRDVEYKVSPDVGVTGVTVTTIRYATDLTVASNPITGPAGSTLIAVDYSDEDGFRMWTATYAKGVGTISTSKEIKEGGKLIVYSATSLNTPPSTPAATIGGTVTLTQQQSRNGSEGEDGTVIYTYEWAEGFGEIARDFTNQNGGAVDFNPATPTASIGPVVCTIRYLTPLSATTDPTTRPASFVRVSVDHSDADGYRLWTVRYGYGAGMTVADEEYKNMGKLTLFHRVSLGSPPPTPGGTDSGQVTNVNLTAGGSGYTSVPTVAFTGGGGTGATAVAVLSGTSIASITLTGGGTGYTSAPTVSITGGGGSGATATAALTGTSLANLTLTNAGANYTSAPTVGFTGGGGSGATASATINVGVLSATITNAGSGYTSPPTVGFSGGGGTGAAGTAVLNGTTLASVSLTNAGSGYTSVPTVSLAGGGGASGAVSATLTPTGIGSVSITNSGDNYYDTPSIAFTGGGTGAAATLQMSSGIAGISLVSGGTGYTSSFPVYFIGGGGSGAAASAIVAGGAIIGFVMSGGLPSNLGYTSPPTLDLSAGGGTGGAGAVTLLGGIGKVSMNSAGTGYTSAPAVVFTGGGGTGAAAVAVLNGSGGVFFVAITNTGSGYTSNPTVSFTGGGGSGATANVQQYSKGSVISATVTAPGSGYTTASASITGGGGSGATASVILNGTTIASLSVTNPGSGYTSTPTLSISGGGGTGGAGSVTLTGTTIASITITNQGTGYTSAPTIGFTGGGGTGGAATANLAPGVVASLTLTAAGTGYTSAPTVTFSGGGGTGASATVGLAGTSLASLTLTAGGSNYTSVPIVSFSGGAGTGATGTTALTPTAVDSVNVTGGGTAYTSVPTVGFSGGAGTGAAATAEIATSTSEVVLISAKFRHEDGYDVYDYTWAEGIGVIEERISARDGGLRMESWTSFGYSAGTSVFTPAGIPVMIDKELGDGVTKWIVTCMQNSAGGDPTSGTALAFDDYEDFTYPGRAKAYTSNFQLFSTGTAFIYDIYQSPPIKSQIPVTVTITYQTSNILGALTYPLWNPTEWATLRAYWQGLDAYGKAKIESLFGYTAIGSGVSYARSQIPYPNTISILGVNALQNSPGSITITGGPGDPGGTTVTILAKLEPAFVSFAGVQYYRKTIVTATIPAQTALPV